MKINFDKSDGLVPAIIQDSSSGRVLMLGYMNEQALDCTRQEGQVTFYSRSKNRLWKKGESSGNFLDVVEIRVDCDGDALLVIAKPRGPTCHTGEKSCFGDDKAFGLTFLADLAEVIASRRKASPESSYVSKLLNTGTPQVARKVGEEAVELVVEALAGSEERLVSEAADLLFHYMVLLESKEIHLVRIIDELRRRA